MRRNVVHVIPIDNRYITEDKPVSDEVPFLPRRDAAQVGTCCLATQLCVVSRLLIGGEVILAIAMFNPGIWWGRIKFMI